MPLQEYTYNKRKYFVDYRLEEFRSDTDEIHFVSFWSEQGDKILTKMLKEGVADITRLNL
jgi:hypothetical protein